MKSWTQFCLTFLVVYTIYHLTLYKSIPGGDSGELVGESCHLGTAHPPGYPLYTMLAHASTFLNIPRLHVIYNTLHVDMSPTVAWRVNHMCCILGALAAALLGSTCKALIDSSKNILATLNAVNTPIFSMSSFLVGFVYACMPLVWEYSIGAEVFALNNFLCSLLIYLTARIYIASCACTYGKQCCLTAEDNEMKARILSSMYRLILCGAFVCGLCLANQHSSVLLVVILVPFILMVTAHHVMSFSFLLAASFSFACGMLPYMYLVVASNSPTPGSWGDMTSIDGLIRHILRSEYGTFQLGIIQGQETGWQRIQLYLAHAGKESYGLVVPFAVIGFWSIWLNQQTKMDQVEDSKEETEAASESATDGNGDALATAVTDSLKKKKKKKGTVSSTLTSKSKAAKPSKGNTKSAPERLNLRMLLECFGVAWVFYVAFWHFVLSNLPLSSPMPFAVHSRFWMQPNLLLFLFAGCGVECGLQFIYNATGAGVGANAENLNNKWWHLGRQTMMLALELVVVVATVGFILQDRFDVMDRSRLGNVIESYGSILLNSLPSNALVASHTDLDWNAVRYLRHCENVRPDVTHVSFQLMPYPWFPSQQAPLYPNVTFPPMFPGVSTGRNSEGNAILIHRFLVANVDNHVSKVYDTDGDDLAGGLYIDMQGINDGDIGAGGSWKNFTLVPWGVLYRIERRLSLKDTGAFHKISLQKLQDMRKSFPVIDKSYVNKFPAGSWEHAAASVFMDAHYQLALNLLTYSIGMQKGADTAALVLILDRLLSSTELLFQIQRHVSAFGTISVPHQDVYRNAAVGWMRLQGVVQVCLKFQEPILKQLHEPSATTVSLEYFRDVMLIDVKAVEDVFHPSGERFRKVLETAIQVIEGYMKAYPGDKDQATFTNSVNSMKAVLEPFNTTN